MSVPTDVSFGFGTAFGYGTADYIAKRTTDRIGFLRTLLYLQALGTPLLTVAALVTEPGAPLPSGPLALLAALSLLNVFAYVFLYRAFEFGTLSIVSPLVSGYPVVIVALAVLVLREPLTTSGAVGIALTLSGVVLLSWMKANPATKGKNERVGLTSAVLALLGFGVFFFALKFVVGPIPPITAAAVSRGVGLVPVVGLAALRRELHRPEPGIGGRMVLITGLDSFALVSYNFGVAAAGSLAILGTVSGLYSAVTIALAAAFLRDRLRPTQWVGVATIFAGIVTISLGSG